MKLMKTLRTRLEKTIPHRSVLAMNKGFRRYAMEPEKILRRQDVRPGMTRHILAAWDRFVKTAAKTDDWEKIHSAAIQEIRGIPRASRTAKAVELFSAGAEALGGGSYFALDLGMFISALVSSFPDADYILHTGTLDCTLDNLGYGNTKNLTINGPVGDFFGNEMQKGKVVISGSAGWGLGTGMSGGSILVKGSAGDCPGDNLVSGEITVEGDAGRDAGQHMKGGILRVMGKIVGISDEAEGGKIYAGGKLMFNKPGVSSKKYLAQLAEMDGLNEFLRASEGDADG